MGNFVIPANAPEDWKGFLADPEKQWRSGYSAKALAYCWEESQGFQRSVKRVFSRSDFLQFKEIEFLVGFPEYHTPLPGGRRPAQSDIFVLARSRSQLIAITVEGKVDEPFDRIVSEWRKNDSKGKRIRLLSLRERLGLSGKKLEHQVPAADPDGCSVD